MMGKLMAAVLVSGLGAAWIVALGAGFPVHLGLLLLVLAPPAIGLAAVWWLTDSALHVLGPTPDPPDSPLESAGSRA
jgi:hypothetical protein